MSESAALLAIDGLTVSYRTEGAVLRGLNDVSLRLQRGRSLGVVGESGSGKSTLSFAVTRVLPANARIEAGRIAFADVDLAHATKRQLRAIRGDRIAMIFQDPLSSLHPCLTIGRQMIDAQRAHARWSTTDCRARALEMLTLVGIPDAAESLGRFPHEFSGGMRQRIMIAAALLLKPDLLIADEPTSALDVTLQGQIMTLLTDLRDRFATALIIVSHDLGVVADATNHVLVLYAGETMEESPSADLFRDPLHPYTVALLSVMPGRKARGRPLPTIPGRVPGAGETIAGCVFASRCAQVRTVCGTRRPIFAQVGVRRVRCHIFDPASGWHAQAPAVAVAS